MGIKYDEGKIEPLVIGDFFFRKKGFYLIRKWLCKMLVIKAAGGDDVRTVA